MWYVNGSCSLRPARAVERRSATNEPLYAASRWESAASSGSKRGINSRRSGCGSGGLKVLPTV